VVRKATLGERGGRPAVAHSVLSRFEALVPPLQAIRERCGAANLMVRARVARTRRGAARRSAGDASDTLLVPAFRLACGPSLHTRREEAWGGVEGEGEDMHTEYEYKTRRRFAPAHVSNAARQRCLQLKKIQIQGQYELFA
jgi:hypothetical protein